MGISEHDLHPAASENEYGYGSTGVRSRGRHLPFQRGRRESVNAIEVGDGFVGGVAVLRQLLANKEGVRACVS